MSDNKLPSTFFNMVLILTLISAVATVALAYTYQVTKEPRAQVEVKKTEAALKAILPEFDNNPVAEKYSLTGYADMEFFPARKGDQPVGWAVKTFSDNGFDSRIWIMAGFDANKNIIDTQVLAMTETPGLGSKLSTEKFRQQFKGKSPAQFKLQVKKDGGSVDALTAATISSRAFCEALDKASLALDKGGAK
jgi:electron transport complex protein RnfG